MKVKEYNEYIQFGFPKNAVLDYCFIDFYDGRYPICEHTEKILLDDEEELEQTQYIWVCHEDADIIISLDQAVEEYFDLKVNPIFKVGDEVVVANDRAFHPDYWVGFENYTAYSYTKTVYAVHDNYIKLSYTDPETNNKRIETSRYSLTGYLIIPISERVKPSLIQRKELGVKLDYAEYITHITPEILETRNKREEAFKTAKILFTVVNALTREHSFHPKNTQKLQEAIELLKDSLNDYSKSVLEKDLK
jgi:hypothetical protein